MKHIKLFNESQEKKTFKNTDDDIKEFFIDYHDKGKLKIEDKFVINGEVINDTPYMKDTSKYTKCKIITINLGSGNGIKLWDKKCINSLDILSQAVHDIQSFYDFMDEDINYTITNDYTGLSIKFVTLGGTVDKSESLSDDIDDWMKRLKVIYASKGWKRINIKSNWFEILIPLTGGKTRAENTTFSISLKLSKIGRGEVTLDNFTTPGDDEIINIRNEAWAKGLKFELTGGDRQIVLKFKKI